MTLTLNRHKTCLSFFIPQQEQEEQKNHSGFSGIKKNNNPRAVRRAPLHSLKANVRVKRATLSSSASRAIKGEALQSPRNILLFPSRSQPSVHSLKCLHINSEAATHRYILFTITVWGKQMKNRGRRGGEGEGDETPAPTNVLQKMCIIYLHDITEFSCCSLKWVLNMTILQFSLKST